MPKYSRVQLGAMAVQANQARDRGEERYLQLVLGVSTRTGMDCAAVQRTIDHMARLAGA